MRTCPRCFSLKIVKNGTHLQAQRYRCNPCGYQFTRKKLKGRSQGDKALAFLLYSHGLSMNAIARLLGVTPPAVLRWIKGFPDQPHKNAKQSGARVMSIGELLDSMRAEGDASDKAKLVLVLPLDSLDCNTAVVVTPKAE